MNSFDWRTDDILRIAANAELEQSACERDSGECFSLVVNGEVCAVIRLAKNAPWIPKFLKSLSESGFPPLTVQDWLVILDIAAPAFFATLNVLLHCGFVARPQRRLARIDPMLV